MMTCKRDLKRIPLWWRRLQALSVKEFLQLMRDPVLMIFIVYAFTGDVYLSASGVSLQLHNASMVFHDNDHSFASRELIHRFPPPYFDVRAEIQDPEEGLKMLTEGTVMIVLDIPAGFHESILRQEQAAVQMQVDTTNSVLGFFASAYGAQIVDQFGWDMAKKVSRISSTREEIPRIVTDHRVWFNPNRKDAWFMSLSELLSVITLLSILLPAAAMVREKERGTLEQLFVSPTTTWQIMIPKVLVMTAVILAGVALSLFAVMTPFFDFPIRGSVLLFFAFTALYILTTSGLGLLASTVTRNLAQVGLLALLLFAPMILLSGTWTPPEAMPLWLRVLSKASPLYHYLEASQGILLRGANLGLLWDSALAMTLLGGGIFGIGLWRFKRQFG